MASEHSLKTYATPGARKPQTLIKIAATGDDSKLATPEIRVKRPKRNVAGSSTDQDYAVDMVLQEDLLRACAELGYPLEPGGMRGLQRTVRVPVYLVGPRLEDTFQSKRAWHNGTGFQCTCDAWRLKTKAEAQADKLPWVDGEEDLYLEEEAYHIGEATRYGWEPAGADAGVRFVRTGTSERWTCNPYTCPQAQLKKGKQRPECGLSAKIILKARGWGSGQLIAVETIAWETNRAFPASWDKFVADTNELHVACPCDLLLSFTRVKAYRGGKSARPYWTIGLPYGMDEEAVRQAGIARAQKALADKKAMYSIAREYNAMLLELNSPTQEQRMGREFQLGDGDGGGDELAALPELSEHPVAVATERLVEEYGYDRAVAETVAANSADDIEGLFERIGEPQQPLPPKKDEQDEPDAEPDAVDEGAADDVIEGEVVEADAADCDHAEDTADMTPADEQAPDATANDAEGAAEAAPVTYPNDRYLFDPDVIPTPQQFSGRSKKFADDDTRAEWFSGVNNKLGVDSKAPPWNLTHEDPREAMRLLRNVANHWWKHREEQG